VSATKHTSVHEDIWLLLPWLANGRLSGEDRDRAEEHVRQCSQCAQELTVQRRLCDSLSAPERVIYAPGPSFRKLLERIDGAGAQAPRGGEPSREETAGSRNEAVAARTRGNRLNGHAALWRPPGLAWAASFILMVGMTAMVAVAYRWSEARYGTVTDHTDTRPPVVLHIALDRDLTIGEVEELLRADGARVVEGPGSTGIFGVTPVLRSGESSVTSQQMRQLHARLRTDPRVRWVQPIDDMDDAAPDESPSRSP